MRFFYTILLFNIFNIGYTQSYKPLLDNYNQWNFTSCNFGCITDIYYTDGDTLVNGYVQKILEGYHYQSRTFLLREDRTNKKVFFTKINSTTANEILLYDFSLNEGQVFSMNNPVTPFSQNGGQFVLDSIRMKPLLNAIEYKHFYFSPRTTNLVSSHPVVWIEGLGSKSLINAPGGEPDSNGVGELTCFFKNETLVYSKPELNENCDFINLKSKKVKNKLDDLKIFNPDLKNYFAFSNPKIIEKIIIYDLMGNQVLFDQNYFKKYAMLNLIEYLSGNYFVVVFDFFSNQKIFKIIIKKQSL